MKPDEAETEEALLATIDPILVTLRDHDPPLVPLVDRWLDLARETAAALVATALLVLSLAGCAGAQVDTTRCIGAAVAAAVDVLEACMPQPGGGEQCEAPDAR